MTRESPRQFDEQDGETEILSALWIAAPSFPQLPPDATQELRALTIDVEDPKKVYSIYHGSRRHGFQVLVERYINQLRYGCQDSRCNIPTCFTCRRRLAGSTPLRRYNATSARTLACHLASQDNPEKGLCQYAGIAQLKTSVPARLLVNTKSQVSVDGIKTGLRSTRSLKAPAQYSSDEIGSGEISPNAFDGSLPSIQHATPTIITDDGSINSQEADLKHLRSIVEDLGEPVERDYKSFIQNLFGTVAFRMLEWLTPTNLESMIVSDTPISEAKSGKLEAKTDKPSIAQLISHTKTECVQIIEEPEASGVVGQSPKPLSQSALESEPISESSVNAPYNLNDAGEVFAHRDEKPTNGNQDPRSRTHSLPLHPVEAASQQPFAKHVNGSLLNNVPGQRSLDLELSKSGLIHGQLAQPKDPENRKTLESHEIHTSKQGRRRLSSLNNSRPSTSYLESISHRSGQQSPTLQNARCVSNSNASPPAVTGDEKQAGLEQRPAHRIPTCRNGPTIRQPSLATNSKASPQSLSILPLEVIEFIGDMLLEDRMRLSNVDFAISDSKVCFPGAKKARKQNHAADLGRILVRPSPKTAPMWKTFIEQSIFYVLSSPKALLETFSEGASLVDTQTLWYCMMRLIQANSSLVFDSLWIAAAELYPPRESWPIYDWAKKNHIHEEDGIVNYTPDETGRLMTIYLHALIAAVPYTRDPAQLFALSRTRSYGISSVQRSGVTAKSVDLYLKTDDAFSDDLILRLARRVFAAIPARRRYQELLGPNETSNRFQLPIADILESVLAPLNFLDIELPPLLAFTQEDREIHEKRAPTLLIDWARTVMLLDWSGRAEVSADGTFGGALAMMAAIYEKRKSLLLGDIHFRTEYFPDRLDSMEMPVEWLSFTPNKKTLHLLDYPYLFSPSNLVTYFRAINFSRMSRSFEASNSMLTRIQNTMAPGTLMTDAGRREDLFNRLRTSVSKFLVLQIRRSDVLADAFNHLWRREQRELSRPLKVKLGEDSGEEGSDSGGVQQEFFRLAIAEALNPDYGTFTVDDRTRMTWFQPGSPQPLWKFELIGLIISLAVYNGLTLPVTFPKALYRKLLGAPVTELHHIEDGWSDLASGLTSLLEWDEENGSVSDVFSRTYEFSIDSFGQQISRDMSAVTEWPQFHEPMDPNPVNARSVDNENRDEYVSDYILWLTDVSVRPQFEAFQRGFLTCLDRRSLSLFDPEILQSVVEGVQEIDIPELRRFTRYVGWDASHQTVKDFWSIVKKFETEEKKKLLEFVTASDRVPVGGMRNLQFVIQRNGVGDIDGHLPTSYTCYGTLLLPEYSSKEVLNEKLRMALENAKGFGFA